MQVPIYILVKNVHDRDEVMRRTMKIEIIELFLSSRRKSCNGWSLSTSKNSAVLYKIVLSIDDSGIHSVTRKLKYPSSDKRRN